MPDANSYTSKAAGITLGILLLLTFIIPFGLDLGNKPVWSWDLLKNFRNMPGEIKAFLLGAWAIGLLALILGAALRGLALATCYLALGIGGAIILFAVAKPFGQMNLNVGLGSSSTITGVSPKTLGVIWVVLTGAFLIIAGIRARLRGLIGVCILQLLIAGGFTALQGILLHDGIRAAMKVPPGMPAAFWWNVIFALIMQGLLALGGLFAFIHGFAFRSHRGELTTAARALAYVAVLLGIVLYAIIAASVLMESGVVFLAALNPAIMLICMLLIFLEGCISFSSELGAAISEPILPPVPPVLPPLPMAPPMQVAAPAPQPGPMVVLTPSAPQAAAPPPAPAAQSVQDRLKQLDAMHSQGGISEDEYKAQRARILEEL